MFELTLSSLITGQRSRDEKILLDIFKEFVATLNSGDLLAAEKIMQDYLKLNLNNYQRGSGYINMGIVYQSLGRHDDALEYYKRVEKLHFTEHERKYILPVLYLNESTYYVSRRDYGTAVEYLEKSLRIFEFYGMRDTLTLGGIAVSYHGLGNIHQEKGDYSNALRHYERSMAIKKKHNISREEITLSGIALCYSKMGINELAEKTFQESIRTAIKEKGGNYYRLPDFYFNYGEFLQKVRRYEDALSLFKKSLNICLRVYGEKNNQTSRAYYYLGKNYLLTGDIDSSLYFYQKSLISIVNDFNDPDITKNPSIDLPLSDLRLMENLKAKSVALEALASKKEREEKLKTLELSLECIKQAMDLADIIRNKYISEESMFRLTGTEKETYISAIRIASQIFEITNDKAFINRMYSIAMKAKASILRSQITGNDLLYSSILPDTLREKQLRLSSDIAAYNKMLMDELNGAFPDSTKISLWKDALFEMNKQKEELIDSLEKSFPSYAGLIRKTIPVPPEEIQKKLEKGESVVDYFLSRDYSGGKRKLYIFIISRNDIKFAENDLDSLFEKNAAQIKQHFSQLSINEEYDHRFSSLTAALHYFHKTLISPIESSLDGNRLIIIPDEEIAWLPFEAFLKNAPEPGRTDFDGLHFLLQDYVISHCYSSLLLPDPQKAPGKVEIKAFSPSYENYAGFDSLGGAIREIGNISHLMGGRSFSFDSATKSNFIRSTADPAIFHLAMHLISDSTNSLYSYLLFGTDRESDDAARLYNYEVSLSNINSPMIVLSACNSGTGTYYSGEGQLSLARSFILAGARSVVRTAWEVNDDAGSEIITRFYYYLSKGKSRDKALQLAKIDFIKSSPPSMQDPYYWAAYEIVGDNGEVVRGANRIVTIVTIFVMVAAIVMIIYSRRRRIFSACLLK